VAPFTSAMATSGSGFVGRRAAARAAMPEFDALRDAAKIEIVAGGR